MSVAISVDWVIADKQRKTGGSKGQGGRRDVVRSYLRLIRHVPSRGEVVVSRVTPCID